MKFFTFAALISLTLTATNAMACKNNLPKFCKGKNGMTVQCGCHETPAKTSGKGKATPQ